MLIFNKDKNQNYIQLIWTNYVTIQISIIFSIIKMFGAKYVWCTFLATVDISLKKEKILCIMCYVISLKVENPVR
jgi:hypothetical protein